MWKVFLFGLSCTRGKYTTAKLNQIVFRGGVYVAKNSSQPANVREIRHCRVSPCAAAGCKSCQKRLCLF